MDATAQIPLRQPYFAQARTNDSEIAGLITIARNPLTPRVRLCTDRLSLVIVQCYPSLVLMSQHGCSATSTTARE